MTGEFTCDVGVAVGEAVSKHGVSEREAALVLLTLAAFMLRELSPLEREREVRAVLERSAAVNALAIAALEQADKAGAS